MNQQDMETAAEDLPSNSLEETGETNLNQRFSGSSKRNYKRGSSKRLSSRSSSDRRHSGDGPSTRPSYKKSSSERIPSSTKRQRRSKHSNNRPSRHHSTDSTKDIQTMYCLTENDEIAAPEEKLSKTRGRRRSGNGDHSNQRSTSRSQLHSSSRGSAVTDVLYKYRNDEDAKEKKKSQGRSPQRTAEPGVQHISSSRSSAINTLYGDEEDAKEKGKRRSVDSKPGVELVSSHSSLAIRKLYGEDSDSKVKAKTSQESSARASVPGVEQIPNPSASTNKSAVSRLYGSDEDDKAKAKASRESSVRVSQPGVEQIFNPSASTNKSTVSRLYGSHEDDKAKAKASRESSVRASQPGAEKVLDPLARSNKSTVSTLYGNDEDAKAKASGRGSEFSGVPVDKVCIDSSAHTAISTLYGGVADSKSKARASRGTSQYASNPGVESVQNNSSTTSTLYGTDSDAKAKGRAAFATNQGVEREEERLAVSLRNENIGGASSGDGENDVQEPVARRVSIGSTGSESSFTNSEPKPAAAGVSAEAMDAVRMPNDPEYGRPRKRVQDNPKESKKKRMACFFLVLLVIGGGISAWYFIFRNDETSNGDNRTSTSDIQNPTTTPSSPTAITFPPDTQLDVGNLTEVPTAPPSIKLLYEPPSKSDCISISLNQTIAGREEMDNVEFGLELEVVILENMTMTEPLVEELLNAIQEKILPSLAGCNIFLDDDVEDVLEAWRFVIFDAFVKGNLQPEKECTDEELVSRNCHRIFVELDLFLKGSMKFLDIYWLISNEEENFSENLGLSDSFEVVKMIGAKSLTRTAAPTTKPSNMPSLAPTEFPTIQVSVNPTSLPTATPTTTVSGQPTRSPTLRPTSEPSVTPSTASTSFPSSNPSGVPSDAPSDKPSSRPSETFSGTPTKLPSDVPSGRPTETPSMTPSHAPSAKPSSSPTVEQSVFPSAIPTRRPSSAPSIKPSALPTNVPSTLPSSSPSILPTAVYWPVGMNKKCPWGHSDRLFKINNVADVDECYNACLSTAGCVVFSVGMATGGLNCMGCTTTATMQNHPGFTAYELNP